MLNKSPRQKGDVFFIESGTVHAIGAGIMICEIQQNSNTTYRVYDYGRRDKDGNTRPLHIEQAIEVANLEQPEKQKDLPEIFWQGANISPLKSMILKVNSHLTLQRIVSSRSL